MAQSFTRNHSDHSNDSGYQFEFFCDKCGNGYRSTFKGNNLGIAAGLLKAAGSLLGGRLAQVGYGADQVKDVFRGQGWDEAFREANEEIRPKFHQCTRCGKWVCPDVCWNAERQLCEECAPDFAEQAAAVQAQVAVEQAWSKSREVDQTGGADMRVQGVAQCPQCSAKVRAGAKFCSACGTALGGAAKSFCADCGGELAPGAKFCAACGAAVAR